MWSDWKNNGCPDIKGPSDGDKNLNGKVSKKLHYFSM